MLFLKVPRKDAEQVRKSLISSGLLSPGYGIINEGGFILFPVSGGYAGFETVERDARPREKLPGRLKDALVGILDEGELEALVGAFDIIGDVAVVEIPAGLEAKEKQVGEALLKVHKNLLTVLKKLGGMEGEYRVRRFACIAGIDKTETLYRENGLMMRLDLAKVYFSPRLATERKRIAHLARDGERILVMFAGVGPFALAISKEKPKTEIVAIELNPDAVRYMKENIVLNKTRNIEAVEGDAKAFSGKGFDRIVMPLPKSAHEFLPAAFAAVKDGGAVHFYTLADARSPFDEALKTAKKEAEKADVGIEAGSMRIVRPYSPALVQVVLDLQVRKARAGNREQG